MNFIKKTILIGFLFLFSISATVLSQERTPLRRPVSTKSPMWIIHIDTWNWADPEKIISLVPEDIKPYVVFNISLSVSDFVIKKYPFTICESWVRACAESGVWAMIQPASGYLCNFPYSISEEYEYFYKNYPNFIGWNWAEQNWGFPSSNEFKKRLDLFVELLKLADKYGGYLSVSNFMGVGNYTNVMGQLKEHPAFEQACKTYSRNYILQDKFTFPSGFYDNESAHLGAFLSGYAGHYGIRFDECGWSSSNPFAESSGIAAVMEHFLLTGATITDGPETIPMQATRQISSYTNKLGFTSKRFEMYSQMVDIHVDMFRKIIDGTFRIPEKQEVINRTKIAYVNDIKQGTNLQKYSSDASLYTGLYSMDGELENNRTWFKKTGRYPSIPMIHKSGNDETANFQVVVTKQQFNTRWPDIQAKINEFNNLFPAEYVGDGYAARINNTWLTYNPYKDGDVRSLINIPFKYNTCESLALSYARFSNGIINEYADRLHIYLNNYCTNTVYGLREDVITIVGCKNEPTFTFKDRGRVSGTVTKSWNEGTFTLKVKHNGPMDIDINCSGAETNRLSDYPETPKMIAPERPPVYYGPGQYEAENFDYRNITSVSQTDLQNYTAMGYLNFGSSNSARVMDTIRVEHEGNYILVTKYRAPSADVKTVDLIINNKKVATPIFTKTVNDARVWNEHSQNVYFTKGNNIIEFKANTFSSTFMIDNIVIKKSIYDFNYDSTATNNAVTILNGSLSIKDKTLKTNNVSSSIKTGVANLDLFPAMSDDYSVIWKEISSGRGESCGVLLRGSKSSDKIAGLKQGYVFLTQKDLNNNIVLKGYKSNKDELTEIKSFNTGYTVSSDKTVWFRASAIGNRLSFECSIDSINWTGNTETAFTDNSFKSGSTQLVWGVGSDVTNWNIDNIEYKSAQLTLTPRILTELNYAAEKGPSQSKSLVFSANSLSGDVFIKAPENFEISLSENTGFTSNIKLPVVNGAVSGKLIYARLKEGLASGDYVDSMLITTDLAKDKYLVLSGSVENKPLTKNYDFQSDVAKTYATTPPAKNVSLGQGNTATAGVVSFKDKNGLTSNMLKPYKGGQRESTGILNLDLFSKQATNYTVTWRQILGSDTDNFKIGVVLRGDSTKIGNGVTGYVNGMMHGYVFIAYTNRGSGNTEFRIYKSTSGNGLETYANVSTNRLMPTSGQPVWFRASVSGNTVVYLNFEYSLNGTSWTSVAKYTDNEATYLRGATQLVWGLGAGSVNFYYDDITYYGVALDEKDLPTGIIHTVGNGDAFVLNKQYFNLVGQPVGLSVIKKSKGIYIERSLMSDGTSITKKIIIE